MNKRNPAERFHDRLLKGSSGVETEVTEGK